jgi:hypothetical protein
VEGYEVITSDEHKLGHVTGTMGDYLVIEHGMLQKTRHPVPKRFAEANDAEQVVRLTISKELVCEAPKVKNGSLDERAVAEHYGLAAGYEEPETQGYGELLPDDPARTAEDDEQRAGIPTAEQERLRAREPDPEAESPGLLGPRRFR